jgi:hypothetical protein
MSILANRSAVVAKGFTDPPAAVVSRATRRKLGFGRGAGARFHFRELLASNGGVAINRWLPTTAEYSLNFEFDDSGRNFGRASPVLAQPH